MYVWFEFLIPTCLLVFYECYPFYELILLHFLSALSWTSEQFSVSARANSHDTLTDDKAQDTKQGTKHESAKSESRVTFSRLTSFLRWTCFAKP